MNISKSNPVVLPLSYNIGYAILLGFVNSGGGGVAMSVEDGYSSGQKTLSTFTMATGGYNVGVYCNGSYWLTVGY